MSDGLFSSNTITANNNGICYSNGLCGTITVSNNTIPDKMREVKIRQLSKGYVVTVGCSEFAFENVDTLLDKLKEYMLEPSETEVKWQQGELFNKNEKNENSKNNRKRKRRRN